MRRFWYSLVLALLSVLLPLPGVTGRAFAQGGRFTPPQEAWMRQTFLKWISENTNTLSSIYGRTNTWNLTAAYLSSHSNYWDTAYSWGDHAAAGYVHTNHTGDVSITGDLSVIGAVNSEAFYVSYFQGTYAMSLDDLGLYISEGRFAGGPGMSLTNIYGDASGSMTLGWNEYAYMRIASGANGAAQRGIFWYSTNTIGAGASGSEQRGGFNRAAIHIEMNAHGASQYGRAEEGSSATNAGHGAMQLFYLGTGEHALTTADGAGSLLLGAGVASNKHCIVVGNGNVSHGDSTVTADGFYGDGSGLTGLLSASVTNGLASTNWVANTWWLTVDASAISAADIINWDTAFGWGDWSARVALLDGQTNNWNAAYGWGDHAGLYALLTQTIAINGETGTLSSNLTFTIAGGGGGDVYAASNNVFTGTNSFIGALTTFDKDGDTAVRVTGDVDIVKGSLLAGGGVFVDGNSDYEENPSFEMRPAVDLASWYVTYYMGDINPSVGENFGWTWVTDPDADGSHAFALFDSSTLYTGGWGHEIMRFNSNSTFNVYWDTFLTNVTVYGTLNATATNADLLDGHDSTYFVTETITNGLWGYEAGTSWVDLVYYPRSNPSNWISHASGAALYGSSNGQWVAVVIPPGDVTAAGDNVFSGSNTFDGTVSMTSNLLFKGSNVVGVVSIDGILGSDADTVDGYHAVSFAILASNNVHAGGTTNDFDQLTATNLTMRGTLNTGGNWVSGDGDSEGVSVDADGKVGVGHTTPAYAFHQRGESQMCGEWASSTDTNQARAGLRLAHSTTQNMVDGFGSAFLFMNGDDTQPIYNVGGIGVIRSGADNLASMYFSVAAGGSINSIAEQVRITSSGNVLIQNTTGTNILSIKQTSTTDPIADSWLTYTCTRTEKAEVEPELNSGYLGRLAKWKTYRYQRIPIVRDDEVTMVTDGIMGARQEAAEKTKATVAQITSKEEDDIRVRLSAAKSAAPKFSAVKVGPMIDDPETPKEIFADGQNYSSGIDLLAYIGFLHAALREEVAARQSLEKRLAKLEGIIKP